MSKSVVLSTPEVAKAFGVSVMTVHNWRKGSPRVSALPATVDVSNRRVTFKEADLKRWAKANGVTYPAFMAPPAVPLMASKPGPKPRAKAK